MLKAAQEEEGKATTVESDLASKTVAFWDTLTSQSGHKSEDPVESATEDIMTVVDSNSASGPCETKPEACKDYVKGEGVLVTESKVLSTSVTLDGNILVSKEISEDMTVVVQQKPKTQLDKNAGVQFLDLIFGRDMQLETTEKLMSSLRLWNLRFDANCEDMLRRPSQ